MKRARLCGIIFGIPFSDHFDSYLALSGALLLRSSAQEHSRSSAMVFEGLATAMISQMRCAPPRRFTVSDRNLNQTRHLQASRRPAKNVNGLVRGLMTRVKLYRNRKHRPQSHPENGEKVNRVFRCRRVILRAALMESRHYSKEHHFCCFLYNA